MAMPLYFIDIHTHDGRRDKDYHGTDPPDAEAARVEASREAHELREGWQHEPPELLNGIAVEVVDEIGKPVLTTPFPR
jgi:hypothetical protein